MRIKQYGKKLVMVLTASITMSLIPIISVQAARVRLSVEGCVLSKGDGINIDVKNENESDGIYRTSNKKVATVSKDGIVKAKKVGAAQISWTKGRKRYVCSIIVGKAPKINKVQITVKEGKRRKISISKFGNSGLKAAWSSSNPDVAVVKNGKVMGISEGTAIITATIKGYTKSYKRVITVTVVKDSLSDSFNPNLPNKNLTEKLPESENLQTGDSSSEKETIIEIITGSSLDIEKIPNKDSSIVTKEAVTVNDSIINIVTDTSITAEIEDKDNRDKEENKPTINDIINSDKNDSIVSEELKLPDKEDSDNQGNNLEQDNSSKNENSENVVTNGSITIDKIEKPEESDNNQKVPEKSMAELVTELVNKERTANNLPELILDTRLTACAEIRAEELIDVFEHTRPDGTLCFTILDENNINYMACAENIAMGQKTPEDVMNSWMNSTGHRNNILNSRYGKIGVGYFRLGNNTYWVQLFTD